jgi:hypothetical protein
LKIASSVGLIIEKMQQLKLNPMDNLQIILVQSTNPSKDTSLRDQLMKQREGGEGN